MNKQLIAITLIVTALIINSSCKKTIIQNIVAPVDTTQRDPGPVDTLPSVDTIAVVDLFANTIWSGAYQFTTGDTQMDTLPFPYSITFKTNDTLEFESVKGTFRGSYKLLDHGKKVRIKVDFESLAFEATVVGKDSLNAFTILSGPDIHFLGGSLNTSPSPDLSNWWTGYIKPDFMLIKIIFDRPRMIFDWERAPQNPKYTIKNGTIRFRLSYPRGNASDYVDVDYFGTIRKGSILAAGVNGDIRSQFQLTQSTD